MINDESDAKKKQEEKIDVKKKQEEKSEDKSEENFKIKVKNADFELASFVWMLDSKILDFMVLRFKMDSFDQEQCISNCLRARNSQCKNIYVIFELPSEKNRKITLTP